MEKRLRRSILYQRASRLAKSKCYNKLQNLPKEALVNPDAFLKPGDIIQTKFAGPFSHEGVYIGVGQVVHVAAQSLTNVARAKV